MKSPKSEQGRGFQGRNNSFSFDDNFLAQGSGPRTREGLRRWRARAQCRGSGRQSVGSDVLLVGLTDDLEGSSSGIGDVCDRVPVQSWPMGHRADLPNRDLWGPPLGKPFLKCCIITKSDEGTGAASWRDNRPSARTGSQCRSSGSRIQSKGRDKKQKNL